MDIDEAQVQSGIGIDGGGTMGPKIADLPHQRRADVGIESAKRLEVSRVHKASFARLLGMLSFTHASVRKRLCPFLRDVGRGLLRLAH
jgi:hypothetical protein